MKLTAINIFQAIRIEGSTVNSVYAGERQFQETTLELDPKLLAVIVTQKDGSKIGIPLGNISAFYFKPLTQADNGSKDETPVTGASTKREAKARTA